MTKRILFITGSLNQTSQMHQIGQQLAGEYECWYSQIYADSLAINFAVRQGWLDHTVLAGKFRERSEQYLHDHNLLIDYRGEKHQYDLVVLCSDMLLPANIRATKTVWVQEGMVDEVTLLTRIVKALKLPRYLSVGTSLNGSSNLCDVYCTASEGYKSFFTQMGTDAGKLFVTGIPNFDNVAQFQNNNFPHHGYVMVATSDIRETFRMENRVGFIKKCVDIAAGRPLLFKFHPNENWERSEAEVRENTPKGTLIYQAGSTNDMIANCEELITQYSTVVYVGIALGKKVHSYFDLDTLYQQAPIQNGGTSARNIANICRAFINFTGKKEQFVKSYQYQPVPNALNPHAV